MQPTHSGIPVESGDSLQVDTYSSVAGVRLRVVVVAWVDGRLVSSPRDVTTDATRSAKTISIQLSECVVTAVYVSVTSGALQRGQCFIVARLIRNGIVVQGIVSNYVTTNIPASYPWSPLVSSINGEGVIKVVGPFVKDGVTPNTLVVPTNSRWRLISFLTDVTTDATVVNRFFKTTIAPDGLLQVIAFIAQFAHGPGVTIRYDGGDFQSSLVAFASNVQVRLPLNITLQAGAALSQELVNGVIGDSQILLLCYEEWIDV